MVNLKLKSVWFQKNALNFFSNDRFCRKKLINTAVDRSEYSVGILLDLAKAFDAVNNDLFNFVGQTGTLWYKRINTTVMVQELLI